MFAIARRETMFINNNNDLNNNDLFDHGFGKSFVV